MTDIQAGNREAFLQALLDITAELSSLQDVEAVLMSIVRHARKLMGSDMAYISLNDYATGETYIRQSDGVLTSEYRTIRMPIGTGILGLVASGVAPYQTTDYLKDDSVPHIARIDEIVAAEGVRTIMGVPVLVRGRVIGALLAAERTPRVFSPGEVDMVSSLGTHAAIALDNAQKYAQALEDAEALTRRNKESLQEVLSLRRTAEFDDELMHQLLEGNDEDGVLRVTAAALGGAIILLDEMGRAVSMGSPWAAESTRGVDPQQLVWTLGRDPRQALDSAAGTGRAQHLRGPDENVVGTVAAVRSGRSLLGFLFTTAELTSSQQLLLERSAVHCALALLFVQAEEDAQHRMQVDVFEELLSGDPIPPARLDRRLRPWGLTSREVVSVALIRHPQVFERDFQRTLRQLSGTRFLAPAQDDLCVIFTDREWIQSLASLEESRGMGLLAAVSGPMPDITGLPSTFRQAQAALSVLEYAGETGVIDSAEVGLVGTVIHLAQESDTVDLAEGVRALINYDEARGTSLSETALRFFDCDRRIDRTAESLFVHRNTVTQRLRTIEKLMAPGWDRAPRALDVHLALRAWWHSPAAGSR
ncbi:helix-turn-helix domain-containing protein [Nesterenkonia sp. E16_7]|uniref:helix-turn-helix domain-containing protein n=1 Tax=unclassified Nesterenkonia TaxID=2629769 RepID=UPI001A92873D|nr:MULTISPECIES: GAF domain-containing protein [unclassified Nesterenkonia]MBO0595930.1 helix-turn-helix domain-containing protein [Nesterenkonia sp. E16_10]MBO0599470.1 helix-turn-helix domain-containing protein [Nesterenkonia sp. E16_7]